MSRKMVAKSLVACDSWQLHEENHLWLNNSKHFRFYWTKKHFISEWYFSENHEIGSLVVRKFKKSWDSGQNRELGLAWESESNFLLLIFLSCLLPGRIKKLHKFINVYLRVGHSANLKHSKSAWMPWSCDSCEMYKIITSWNGNDLWQWPFWYRALSCGADWFTKGVYIWVIYLHIAVPTITCSLRYA